MSNHAERHSLWAYKGMFEVLSFFSCFWLTGCCRRIWIALELSILFNSFNNPVITLVKQNRCHFWSNWRFQTTTEKCKCLSSSLGFFSMQSLLSFLCNMHPSNTFYTFIYALRKHHPCWFVTGTVVIKLAIWLMYHMPFLILFGVFLITKVFFLVCT